MCEETETLSQEEKHVFRPYTRESLGRVEARIAEEKAKKKELQKKRAEGEARYEEEDDDDGPAADPQLEAGMPLPIRLAAAFPTELTAIPLEDIDPYYHNKKTFIVISKGKDIFRYSAEDSMWFLSPFSPVRRVAIHIMVHPLFSLIIIVTILLNCIMMIMKPTEQIESSEVVFTAIYTFESATKVMGRGFAFAKFTYLRDAWNWLDFIVISLAYLTMGIDLGNLAALRTFRVLRALKTVAIIPGLKTIVGAVIESVKNLRDVIVLTLFALSVFALLGLQVYMGFLSHKCIRNFPVGENGSWGELNHHNWFAFTNNRTNWYRVENARNYQLCGNMSGAGVCPDGYTCYEGFGENPDNDFTSFDTFGWSFLCAFRLMTQDYWEDLYQMVLRTAGPWHIIFFLVIIFLGSFYLVNLILAIVAMSYDELQKKAEEEEEAALLEEEAMRREAAEREAEEAAMFDDDYDDDDDDFSDDEDEDSEGLEQVLEEDENDLDEGDEDEEDLDGDEIITSTPSRDRLKKSVSDVSGLSYQLYIQQSKNALEMQNKDAVSLKSDFEPSLVVDSINGKESMSLPGSPFQTGGILSVGVGCSAGGSPYQSTVGGFGNGRPLSRSSHSYSIRRSQKRARAAFFEAHNSLPYMDDSRAESSMCSFDEAASSIFNHSRQNSYCSHASRVTYNSHAELATRLGSSEFAWRSRERGGAVTWGNYVNYWHANNDHNFPSSNGNGHINNKVAHNSMKTILPDLEPKPRLSVQFPEMIPRYSTGGSSRPGSTTRPTDTITQAENPFIKHNRSSVEINDVRVLNDILEQASRRPSARRSTIMEDQEGVRLKERLADLCTRCVNIFCVWDCCACYIRLSEILSFIVFDPFADLFITLCIVVNTLCMALDQHDQDPTMQHALNNGNYFFTATFAVEAVMKLMAMSPKYYFKEGWNIFDFIIVFLSLIELGLANVSGLSVLRSFRLLRVFKLAKSWPTLNLLISIMGKTMGALGNLTFVLCIIIFIFAVMGMQLFGKSYTDNIERFPGKIMPRWNFIDFMHSFMIVFRVLCGEWIESMWDCMWVASKVCVPFFLATVVIGNLVVLNLFLALLLSSFGASNLSAADSGDDGTNKLAEAFNRIGRFKRFCRRKIICGALFIRDKTVSGVRCCIRFQRERLLAAKGLEKDDHHQDHHHHVRQGTEQQIDAQIGDGMDIGIIGENGDVKNPALSVALNHYQANSLMNSFTNSNNRNQVGAGGRITDLTYTDTLSEASYGSHMNTHKYTDTASHKGSHSMLAGANGIGHNSLPGEEFPEEENVEDILLDVNAQELLMQEYPADCCPVRCYLHFPCMVGDEDSPFWQGWANLRVKTYRLIENKYFETAVIAMILLSSLALAAEDIYLNDRPVLQDVLYYMDKIFTVIFFMEMSVKWLALGFVKYFTNAWCWLDFVIVMVSLINFTATLLGAGGIQAFKTMRTLRALRPLRAMSRMQGMRIVVNALVQAIPSIFNVLLVCIIFWLIFAIMGVQLFAGKFYRCQDVNTKERLSHEIVPDVRACLAENNTEWVNSPINFDNVGNAYICLFQTATFKGWIPIMSNSVDSRDLGQQPIREINIHMYLYFVLFIVFGSFFTLNLFIGVIIDNFNEQKKKAGGSLEMFMTEDQKKYYAAMKKMGKKKPVKAIPRPRWRPQAIVFGIVTNKKFDMIIMMFIGLNMLTMTLDHYHQSEMWNFALNNLNMGFICIFTTECALKIFALRQHYFKEPWNIFDFVVVILSIFGILLSDLIEKYFVSPTLLRVVRVAKIGRVLRLVKSARGIRTLLFALAMSMPALFNICLLLFLVMFIFAIFGKSFFMNVKLRGTLDEVYNFRTFGQSMILLFQMSTSAGWDGVLNGIMDEDDCEPANTETGYSGNCGNTAIGITFLLSYLVISFLIVINMYIAVILENYSQATEDVTEGLTGDDYDMYYEIWQQFDPEGSQYIRYSQLSDFLDVLEPPLQIHKPNKFKIISMDIPICRGDFCFCVDVLDALTKDFFARKGNPVEETAELGEVTAQADRPGYSPISSTLWRQREEYCARMIQSVWRKQFKITRSTMPPPPGTTYNINNGNQPPPPPAATSALSGFVSLLVRPDCSILFSEQAKIISEVTQRLARNFASVGPANNNTNNGKAALTTSTSFSDKDANTNPTALEADGLVVDTTAIVIASAVTDDENFEENGESIPLTIRETVVSPSSGAVDVRSVKSVVSNKSDVEGS
uniref:Sodium channel protein n=1 Tax=Acartia hudsonica TaxID=198241 RepID=A0A125R3Q9_9MAXI|nr:sodium channel alpha subunit [Acartia hudsonica]